MVNRYKPKNRRKAQKFTLKQDQLFRKLYPNTKNSELAKKFNVPQYYIENRGWYLGLKKSDKFKKDFYKDLGKKQTGKNNPFAGKKHSKETIKKFSKTLKEQYKSGRVNFFKGKTKKNDFIVKKRSLKLKGKPKSEEHRKKLSEARKGVVPYNKDKKLDITHPETHPFIRKKMSKSATGRLLSEETKKKKSIITKNLWKKQEYVEKVVKNVNIKPTLPEKKLMELFTKENLPIKYTGGDLKFRIGTRSPDFIIILFRFCNTSFSDPLLVGG